MPCIYAGQLDSSLFAYLELAQHYAFAPWCRCHLHNSLTYYQGHECNIVSKMYALAQMPANAMYRWDGSKNVMKNLIMRCRGIDMAQERRCDDDGLYIQLYMSAQSPKDAEGMGPGLSCGPHSLCMHLRLCCIAAIGQLHTRTVGWQALVMPPSCRLIMCMHQRG